MHEKVRRQELAQFLRTRRQRITPEDVGLASGTRRRTPGLRREELALLAGVGATWYTWLEQGRAITVSGQVLESLGRVLQLDADEQAHLFILAHQQLPAHPLPITHRINPDLQLILDAMGIYPAIILSPRWDIVAWNRAACQVLADFNRMTSHERHILWFLFTDPQHRALALDWERDMRHMLALFRASTQRYIGETWLSQLINDLEQISPEFREWWACHDVQGVQTEHKHLIHPQVGLLTLQARTFQVADHPDLQMIVYTPVANTDTASKLVLLSEIILTPSE